ncbi:SGNH/GDSL hydrolase family protein [Paenibacillus sp. 2TAB23]|uniref:SGNH/GDSL hydrolase family protein n=1 Tax=Paenibacillus sp. 2TAB23 TaxID=3233004 RepID=UPI003F9A74C5
MMIYQNVELHNVAEVVSIPGKAGVLLQRLPKEVLVQVREAAQAEYKQSACCEIRFVNDWKPVKVTLSSCSDSTRAYLYFGDFAAGSYLIGKEPTTLEISVPSPALLPLERVGRAAGTFAPQVWRLLFQGGEIHLIHVEGDRIRPPRKDELPSLRYLAYGTSITQGIAASHPALAYVKQVGWRLHADVINLGASGAAYCEPAIADYIADCDDWDIASLCVSANMLNQGVSAAHFEERAGDFVRRITDRHPSKPIVCIGLFPIFYDLGLCWPARNPAATADEYRAILQSITEDSVLSNVHYIDGRELLKSTYGLSHDLLHPGDHGMIEIGENLATFMKVLL